MIRFLFSVHQTGRMIMTESEQGNLIGSDKVEGTAVYGANDEKIGTVERVMIDKQSGQVSYAVLAFGGFLGMGEDHYPLPWTSLKYDTNLGGYKTNLNEERLQGALRSTRPRMTGVGVTGTVSARLTNIMGPAFRFFAALTVPC